MLVWIEFLSKWIFLNQTMLVENLQQLGLCELQALVQVCQTLGLAQLLLGHRTDGFIEHVRHVKKVLAETLNTEYFCISHLFILFLKFSKSAKLLRYLSMRSSFFSARVVTCSWRAFSASDTSSAASSSSFLASFAGSGSLLPNNVLLFCSV